MFTYICPKCGREVPPSYEECPNCAGKSAPAAGGQPEAPAPAAPSSPGGQYSAAYPPPQAPAVPAPPVAPPPAATAPPAAVPPTAAPPVAGPPKPQTYIIQEPQRHLPGWVVTILVAAGFAAVLALVYFVVIPRFSGSGTGASAPESTTTSSAAPDSATLPAATVTKAHPYARYIELTGFRISEDKNRKAQITLLMVNHSASPLDGLELKVDLYTDKSGPDDPPVTSFTAHAATIPAYGSTEITERIQTNLRAYELPDWQFLRAKFEIVKPQL